MVDQALAPALEEGLLVAEPGAHPAVRFRHDRIREVILGGLGPGRQQALQLAMARRLAAVPGLFAIAAGEQYLWSPARSTTWRSEPGWWSCCGGPPARPG